MSDKIKKAVLQGFSHGGNVQLSIEFATHEVHGLNTAFIEALLIDLFRTAHERLGYALIFRVPITWSERTYPERSYEEHLAWQRTKEARRRAVTSRTRAGQEVFKCPQCSQPSLLKTEVGDACIKVGCYVQLSAEVKHEASDPDRD
jgi:hypothetical protein